MLKCWKLIATSSLSRHTPLERASSFLPSMMFFIDLIRLLSFILSIAAAFRPTEDDGSDTRVIRFGKLVLGSHRFWRGPSNRQTAARHSCAEVERDCISRRRCASGVYIHVSVWHADRDVVARQGLFLRADGPPNIYNTTGVSSIFVAQSM
jgi:hypothetical protein